MTQKPLSPRAERFARDEYPKDLNAAAAAERSGYSPRTANRIGHVLLKDPRVQRVVQARCNALTKKAGMEAEEVLSGLSRISRVDMAEAFDANNCLLPIHEIPEHIRYAIAAIEVEELFEWEGEGKERKRVLVGYTKKVKFWDKKGALDSMGRHHKLFVDKIEHDVSDKLADRLAAARKRVADGR